VNAKNVTYKTKNFFAAALVKHTNNPVRHSFYFLMIVVVNKLLFFDCSSIFNKIFIKFTKMAL